MALVQYSEILNVSNRCKRLHII